MPPTSQLCGRLTSALQGSLSGLRSRLCAQGSGRAWRVGQRTKTAEDTVTGPQAAASPALCFVCSSSTGRGVQVAGVGGERGSGQGRQEALPFAGGLRPAASVMTSPLRSLLSRPVAPSGLQTQSLHPFPSSYSPWSAPRYSQSRELGLKLIPALSPVLIHPFVHSLGTDHVPCVKHGRHPGFPHSVTIQDASLLSSRKSEVRDRPEPHKHRGRQHMTSVRKVPRALRRRVHEFRSRLRGDSGDIPSHISCCPRLPLRETLLTAGGGFSTGRWTLGSRLLSQKLRLVHTESEDPHGPVTSLVLKEQLRIIVPHSPGVEQKGCFNLILTVPNFCHLRIWRRWVVSVS